MTPEECAWAVDQTGVLILAAIDGDIEKTARSIQDVGERLGNNGVYAMCCAVAEAIAVIGKFDRAKGWHGFAVEDAQTGADLGAEAIQDDSILDGMRFLVAHLNDEHDTKLPLFYSNPVRVSTGLAKLVGAYGRAAEAAASTAGEVLP